MFSPVQLNFEHAFCSHQIPLPLSSPECKLDLTSSLEIVFFPSSKLVTKCSYDGTKEHRTTHLIHDSCCLIVSLQFPSSTCISNLNLEGPMHRTIIIHNRMLALCHQFGTESILFYPKSSNMFTIS